MKEKKEEPTELEKAEWEKEVKRMEANDPFN
jgi:hypothetical protein